MLYHLCFTQGSESSGLSGLSGDEEMNIVPAKEHKELNVSSGSVDDPANAVSNVSSYEIHF